MFFLLHNANTFFSSEYVGILGIKLMPHDRETTVENHKFTIMDSIFYNCSTNAQSDRSGGGAIAINKKAIYGVIDRVVFDTCSSTGYGGAICLKSTDGYFQICCTIALKCVAKDTLGNFIKSDGKNQNFFNLSSISMCGNSNFPTGSAPVSFSGHNFAGHINSSINDCFSKSGSEFLGNSNLTMCSFIDNSATDASCLLFSYFLEMKFVNIIKNYQLNTEKGMIVLTPNGNYHIFNTYIAENKNGNTFQCKDAKLQIESSFIDVFTSDVPIDFVPDQSQSQLNITFFIGNLDAVLRPRPTRTPAYRKGYHNNNELLIQSQKRRKQLMMFILLSIVVICTGILAIISTGNDDLPEEEPLLLKKKKKAALSPMNAIV